MNRKTFIHLFVAATLSSRAFAAMSAEDAANTIILDETGVKNLRIETVEVEETDFEETAFSLGRIESIPERRAVVASRISGRVVENRSVLGALIEKDSDVLRIESRQPGDPPPSIWLKAPLGGLITESSVRIGEPVEPDKSLLEITDLAEVYAVARVPEHLAGKVKAGSVARVSVPALPGAEIEGTLLRFGIKADHESGTIDAIFTLPNPEKALRPGMRAEFSIVTAKREGVISVPRQALHGDAARRFIYRRHYDQSLKNAFVRIPVVTGTITERLVEITEGLTAGDEVVTTGSYSLAFAGKGTVSLKEALDAAHGHPHNEDGSEMTPEQRAAAAKSGGAHEHGHSHSESNLTVFFASTTALLFILLIVMGIKLRGRSEA